MNKKGGIGRDEECGSWREVAKKKEKKECKTDIQIIQSNTLKSNMDSSKNKNKNNKIYNEPYTTNAVFFLL